MQLPNKILRFIPALLGSIALSLALSLATAQQIGLPGIGGGTGATPGGSSGQLQTNNGSGGFGAVAAPAGAVVGTTDTQTLTNKSIAGPEINSGTVPLAQMPSVGVPPYITGGNWSAYNPYAVGGTIVSSAVGVANSYYCAPRWLFSNETVKELWIRIGATSTGNSSNALQGAVYQDSVQSGVTSCGAAGGSCHRPGVLIDYADNGNGTGFATGSALTVGATMHNTTDAITGPAQVWDCVQTFDTTVTFGSLNNNSGNLISAAIGSAIPNNLLAATPLSSVSATGSAFGGANWVNFTGATTWSENAATIHAPVMLHESN